MQDLLEELEELIKHYEQKAQKGSYDASWYFSGVLEGLTKARTLLKGSADLTELKS